MCGHQSREKSQCKGLKTKVYPEEEKGPVGLGWSRVNQGPLVDEVTGGGGRR